MEQLTLKIPYDFVQSRLGRPSWQDVLFGLQNELLDPAATQALAIAELDHADANDELIELASLEPGEPVAHHVERLAEREAPQPQSSIAERWLYLTLAWLFDHRDSLPDPLGSVETVYAEFDYPEGIAGFVRYMPSDGPDLGDRKLNEERMLGTWQAYLSDARSRLLA